MADEPFYTPFRQSAPPRQPKPGRHLWTVTQGTELRRAELRDHPAGAELQLFNQVELISGRTYAAVPFALADADALRDALIADGWRCARCHGEGWLDEDPCANCNNYDPPRPPRGFVSFIP